MKLTLEEMKDNRRKWVEALRSGDYEQAIDWLIDGDGYCCLGVLARVNGVSNRALSKCGTLGDFPAVMDAVGLRTDTGDYGSRALTIDNDEGKSFSEIADIIESEPRGLFVESV